MKVLIAAPDSKIPNLAIMKVAGFYRSQGDEVGWHVTDPDKVYMSIVFDWNRHLADGLRAFYPNAEVNVGGSGYDLYKVLPYWMRWAPTDYSIYPECDSYYGFVTRGCNRRCHFCIVREKEGSFHFENFVDRIIDHQLGVPNGGYDKLTLLDNNILFSKNIFRMTVQEIKAREHIKKVDFNQGLDIRLLDTEVADALATLTPINTWKFAFDSEDYEHDVRCGIRMLENAGVDIRRKVMFYVYCDGEHDLESAVRRCRILKEMGTLAFAMVNTKANVTKPIQKLKDWTRPEMFFSCDYSEVDRRIRHPAQRGGGGEEEDRREG